MVALNSRFRALACLWGMAVTVAGSVFVQSASARVALPPQFNHLSVPIIALTLNQDHRAIGVVRHVILHFQKRYDQEGLRLRFNSMPGKFSPLAQHAVKLAIERVAAVANMHTIDWTVNLTFPYPGMTVYGESLSAMVGLSVLAMAKGEAPISGRSITGTITEDGHIGKVGGVPEKIYGAHQQNLNRILIPEEQHIGDGDWPTPFLMHVSPVSTVQKAYLALTGHRLFPSELSSIF